MKRKRSRQSVPEECPKRVKLVGAARSVLRQHYPQVSSLREYLLCRLDPGTSKHRKGLISKYGKEQDANEDPDLAELLDQVLVGHQIDPQDVINLGAVSQEQELSIFSQELSECSGRSVSTSTLSQAEVRKYEWTD